MDFGKVMAFLIISKQFAIKNVWFAEKGIGETLLLCKTEVISMQSVVRYLG